MWTLRVVACLAGLLCASAALADDWTAVRLRGQLLELVDKQWQPVARGATVADGTVVRSTSNGYADFVRGSETVSVSPNTELEIADAAAAGSKPFTTVTEFFGTVSVEADVEKVQHFAVVTPYLAAVVKGTKFTVSTGQNGGGVAVTRGHVEVISSSDHSHVLITVGQAAWVAKFGSGMGPIVVTGQGPLPSVTGSNGKPVPPPSSGVVSQTLSTLGSVVKTISQTIGSTVQSLGNTVGNTVTSLTGGVSNLVGGTTSTVGGVVGTVGDTVGGVVHTVGNTAGGVVGTVGNTVGGVVGGVTGTLGHLLGKL